MGGVCDRRGDTLSDGAGATGGGDRTAKTGSCSCLADLPSVSHPLHYRGAPAAANSRTVADKGILHREVCQSRKRGVASDLPATCQRTGYCKTRRKAGPMRNQPPCIAWAEKLALRQEDLSPADRANLDAHIKTCPACEAAQEDYYFLDTRLRALPPSTLKPLPRLSLHSLAPETAETVARMAEEEAAASAPRSSSAARRNTVSHRFVLSLRRALPVALVASLVLALLLVFGIQSVSKLGFKTAGATLLSYTGHTDYVDAVAWSPNSQFIASGSWDGTVQVWDAHTGAIVTTYKGHSDIVSTLAWSPDGQDIASGSWDGTARVWDAFTGALQTLYLGHSDAVSALAWSPDGQYIASGSWDHTVQVWYARTGETLFTYKEHTEFVEAVAWSPNGQYIASGDRNDTVQVWNARTGNRLF